MRDPKRIDNFCNELKAIWHCVPDYRFGQLMSNMLSAYMAETKRDIFYVEDEEMMRFFREYVMKNSPYIYPDE